MSAGGTPEKPLISVVLIAYKRVDRLRRTVESFRRVTRYPRLEYILSDDGSPPEIQAQMREIPFDQYLMSPRNRGLGHNQNKGVRAARGEFIFHLQDDWVCKSPPDFLEAALELFDERPDVVMIRFDEEPRRLPHETHALRSGRTARIYVNGRCTELGEYGYTDRPHIKRRSFHEQIGWYREGVPMTRMEAEIMERFDGQQALRFATIEGYAGWDHIGTDASFNPTYKLAAWRQRLLSNPITRYPFMLFLKLRGRKI